VKRSIALRPIKNQRRGASGDKKIHNFGARRANVTGLGARVPRAEELALPKSLESGNFTLATAVIRWMSGESVVIRFF
jgi:hypothetical protein